MATNEKEISTVLLYEVAHRHGIKPELLEAILVLERANLHLARPRVNKDLHQIIAKYVEHERLVKE